MKKIFNSGDKPITVRVPSGKLILSQPSQEITVWCDSIKIESRKLEILVICYKNNRCITTFSFFEQTGADFRYKHLIYEEEEYHLWMRPVIR